MSYSVYLVNSKGIGSYLSVKGRTSWKTKRTAVKHRNDILACKNPPFDVVTADVEDEFGDVVA